MDIKKGENSQIFDEITIQASPPIYDYKEGEGGATIVADYLRPDTLKVGEGSEGDEYVIVRLGHVIPAVSLDCSITVRSKV